MTSIDSTGDFELTKAVCQRVRKSLALIPPALDKVNDAAGQTDLEAVTKQCQVIFSILARLDGYLDGVQEGI